MNRAELLRTYVPEQYARLIAESGAKGTEQEIYETVRAFIGRDAMHDLLNDAVGYRLMAEAA